MAPVDARRVYDIYNNAEPRQEPASESPPDVKACETRTLRYNRPEAPSRTTCATRPPGTFVKNKTDPSDWVDWDWFLENGQGPGAALASELWKMKEKKGLKANDIVHKLLKELTCLVQCINQIVATRLRLDHDLHAIDATPARFTG